MGKVLELAVRQPLTLKVDGVDYTVEFPLSSVVIAEEKIGRGLKSPADWFGLPDKDIPAVLEAGLIKHHADKAGEIARLVCDALGPESSAEFTEALGAMAFPRFLARYKENLAKIQAKGGTASPNGPSVAVL